MTFTFAIVGRPNVGKSTLFNRLLGRKIAIVDDQPGVTRDLKEAEAKLGSSDFKIVDTAGLEQAKKETLQYRMTELSINAVSEAHACIFVIDARAGLTSMDYKYAELVRRLGKDIILVSNKSNVLLTPFKMLLLLSSFSLTIFPIFLVKSSWSFLFLLICFFIILG